ncbi:MAG: SOS response-associated peptidase [Opitutales bacterium]|jgi:putative SOS response-associated peptidase YedK
MCGRYTLSAGHEALARAFLAEFSGELQGSWQPRYNIAPGSGIVAIVEDRDKGGRRGDVFHWGLVPSWAKDPDIGYKLINARAETVGEKASYRDAYRYRRCLVPASGFYEWDRRKSPRQPYYFHPAAGELMAMAGVWEHWMHPCGSEILSLSLLTTSANKTVGRIHHRMPVLLDERDWDAWLDTTHVRGTGLRDLLKPAEEEFLQSHPVGIEVNNSSSEGEGLILPLGKTGTETTQLDLF